MTRVDRFANIKDGQERLNEHTKAVLAELGDLSAIWSGKYDGRGIYIALQTFANYYWMEGVKKLGNDYMTKCNDEAVKLSNELAKR